MPTYAFPSTNASFGAVKPILRYIKGFLHQALSFIKGPLSVSALSDADWEGDALDRRFTSGFCLFFGHNLVSRYARKKHIVARSSTEAEYRFMASTTADISWLVQLLRDLHVPLLQLLLCL